MKFRKIFTTAVVGLALSAFAGTAAADMAADINIYGASAQFNFWKINAPFYIEDQNCSVVGMGTYDPKKDIIFKATCDSGVRYIRISSKASYDGVLAIQGNTTHPNRVTECADPHQRKMVDETTCTFPGSCSGTKCVTVNVGASDVAVDCFTQYSYGEVNGPAGGGKVTRDFKRYPVKWTGAQPCRPLIVPFAFFVNNTVTKGSNTIGNITRDDAEIIFSGQAFNWSDLVDVDGVAFDSKAIAICLRHAGSGTHASLDAYLNSQLIETESAADPIAWFNDGSSQMMNCVNTLTGAIGYADADQSLGSYPNARRLKLNGTPADGTDATMAAAIKGGDYNFYGWQHLYGVVDGDPLCDYFKTASITAPWAAECAMVFERTGGNTTDPCGAFPVGWVGNRCP